MHSPSTLSPRPSIGFVAIFGALFWVASPPCAAQTVSGTVVADESGLPLDGARVALQSLDGTRSTVVAVDGRGLFRLTVPAPGCYRLSVVLEDDVIPAADLSLAPGDTASLHLSMAAPGEVAGAAPLPVGGVSGQVSDAVDGRPVAGVSLRLSAVARRTVTDADGRFHLPGVPAGVRQVTVERAGYMSLTDSVEVEADGMLEMNVALQPEAGPAHRLLAEADDRATEVNRWGVATMDVSAAELEALLRVDLQNVPRREEARDHADEGPAARGGTCPS